jgi:hypothetical protein
MKFRELETVVLERDMVTLRTNDVRGVRDEDLVSVRSVELGTAASEFEAR